MPFNTVKRAAKRAVGALAGASNNDMSQLGRKVKRAKKAVKDNAYNPGGTLQRTLRGRK